MKRVVILLVILCLPAVVALQHGYLVFDLDGWTPLEQSTDHQFFEKDSMQLDIRASAGSAVMDPAAFAELHNGSVGESDEWDVVITANAVWLFSARAGEKGEEYRIVLVAPLAQRSAAETEMRSLIGSLAISPELVLIEAPWERELAYPDELPFLTRHPIPWGWIIVVGVIALLLWRKIKKRRTRKQRKEEPEEKEAKTTKESEKPHKKAKKRKHMK